MIDTTLSHSSDRHGVQCDKLNRVFDALFSGRSSEVKNSVGVYTPDKVFMCKRAVRFSKEPIRLCEVIQGVSGDVFDSSLVWGVCSEIPTRANETFGNRLLLVFREGRRFISRGIVSVKESSLSSSNLEIEDLDMDNDRVTSFLEGMRKETRAFSLKRQAEKKRRRQRRELEKESLPEDRGEPAAKQPCVEHPVSQAVAGGNLPASGNDDFHREAEPSDEPPSFPSVLDEACFTEYSETASVVSDALPQWSDSESTEADNNLQLPLFPSGDDCHEDHFLGSLHGYDDQVFPATLQGFDHQDDEICDHALGFTSAPDDECPFNSIFSHETSFHF